MATGFDPDPRYARYPFLSGAREAVERAGVDVAALVADEPAVVERARDRVRHAVEEGTAGPPHRSNRVELLSYPVARLLVSLVEEPELVERFAAAEAASAVERFWTDREVAGRQTVDRRPLALDELLGELELAAPVHRLDADDRARGGGAWNERDDAFEVRVATYLRLASDQDGQGWRLRVRRLHDGWVPVDGDEFEALLETAIAERVAEGLPLRVPEEVADGLDDAATAVRESLADLDVAVEIDTVVPELFPPCARALLSRARDGDDLADHSRFALAAFLVAVGLDPDEAVALADPPPETGARLRKQAAALDSGDGTQYTPPSCATMQAYGDCVDMDELCETIAHPLEYYEQRLDDAEDVADWREDRADG